jgi:hypothetical protein
MLHFNRSTEVLGEVIAVHDGLHVGSHKRYKIKHVGVVVLIMCYVLLESYVQICYSEGFPKSEQQGQTKLQYMSKQRLAPLSGSHQYHIQSHTRIRMWVSCS